MLIVLDRDGVINHDSPNYIRSPDEWHPIDGSLAAIAKLHAAGHIITVATNQSGVGRGYYTEQTLHNIHEKMQQAVVAHGGKLDGIYYCPHTPDDHCTCRKPKPGLLLQISKDFNTPLENMVFVGDSIRDISAAHAAHCKSALVLTGNGIHHQHETSVPIYKDLADFAEHYPGLMKNSGFPPSRE